MNDAAVSHRAWPHERTLVVTMWAAFAVLHAILFWLDLYPASRVPFGDEVMYRALAERLAAGQAAAPELLWPPFYAWFLAPFARLGAGWPHAAAAAQVALLATTAVVAGAFAARITGSRRAALVTQALVLVEPQLGGFAHYLWPEVLHALLLFLLFWLLAARPGGHLWWMAAGVVLGVVALTKSFAVPFAAVLLVALVVDTGWRHGLPRAAGVLAIAIATALPAMAANARREGVWVVADSSRFNLWVGLTQPGRRSSTDDIAGREYLAWQASGDTFADRQRVLDAKLAALVQGRGLPALARAQASKQYFRLFDHESILTAQLAGGPFVGLRVGYVEPGLVVSGLLRAWSLAAYALVLAAAGPGLLGTPLRGRTWLIALFLLLAYGLLLFFGLEARSRYRLPLLLPLFTAAALAIDRGRLRDPSLPRWRGVAGVALSLLFLAFAFGGSWLP